METTPRVIKADEDWESLEVDLNVAFSPGAPIREREVFAGRLEQIDKLVQAVAQRGRHAAIYGERGVGKTSLANILKLLLHRPNKQMIAVRVNCSSNDTFDSLFRKVFLRLEYETSNGRVKLADDYKDQQLNPDIVQLELDNFELIQNTVIVLDEFDRIEVDQTKKNVTELIKALSDYSVPTTVVVVGIAEDVNSLIEEHNSITRCLVQVQMPRMSQEELSEIVCKRYSQNGIKIDEDALWKLTFLARGLPYYAHLLGLNAAIKSVRKKRTNVVVLDVEDALNSATSEIDATVLERYMKATVSQKGDETLYEPVLLACALATTDELGRFQQSAVAEPLGKIKKKRYHPSTFAFHMNKFCEEERGAILERFGEKRNYRYRFREAIMPPFVIMKGMSENVIDDDITQTYANRRQLSLPI